MKILLAVDGSDASMTAVASAAALPLPPGCALEVVSVIPESFVPEGSPWPGVVRVDPPTDRERIRDDVRLRLVDIADRLSAWDRTVVVRVLEGRPASEIIIEAGRFVADLIVVGARGLSTVRRMLIGSVSAEVVDHAPCPVLVARRGAIDRVLFATDGSPDAMRAAEFISGSSLFGDAEIRVVSVVDPGMPWWTGLSPVDGKTSIDVYSDAVEAARHRATAAADEGAALLAGDHSTAVAVPPDGDVASAIVADAKAWSADIVVVGSRSIGPLRRVLIGSISRSVLHHAPMSVLIVRRLAGSAIGPEPTAGVAVSA